MVSVHALGALLPNQLPASLPGEAAEGLCTHVGDPQEAPGSLLHTGPALVVVAIGE